MSAVWPTCTFCCRLDSGLWVPRHERSNRNPHPVFCRASSSWLPPQVDLGSNGNLCFSEGTGRSVGVRAAPEQGLGCGTSRPILNNHLIQVSERDGMSSGHSALKVPRRRSVRGQSHAPCHPASHIAVLTGIGTSWSKPQSDWRGLHGRPQADMVNNALFTGYKGRPVSCANQNGAGKRCHSVVLLQVIRTN